jgi:beta-N-acetylhexosaminidase
MTLTRRSFLKGGVALASAVALPSTAHAATSHAPKTLREKVGQLFVVSFRGTSPDPAFLYALHTHGFGGVVLYGRNYSSPAQLKALVHTLQSHARFPLLISTDQEGGAVVRIHGAAPAFPSEAAYGRSGSAAKVYGDAASTAHALRSLGLSMNLAPVVDVLSNPRSPIGDRSYGSNPHLAATLSVAAIRGYQQHGLAATAKHFIGLGHASIDSHQSLPTVTQTLAQLDAVDMVPFRAAVQAGVSALLVAHVALPSIDPVRNRPASLSPAIIGGVIRRHLGFRGLIMTDSLAMGALPQGSTSHAAVQALTAGADMLLISANHDIPTAVFIDAIDRVVSAVQAGQISQGRLDSAVARVLALKRSTRRQSANPLRPTVVVGPPAP